MSVFETSKKHSSVSVAKNRLKVLLVSDRVDCTPDKLEKINLDLYQTVSKYIDVNPEEFHVRITRSAIYINFTGDKL